MQNIKSLMHLERIKRIRYTSTVFHKLDLYQVTSYAIRRKATDILLIYPKILSAQEEGEGKKVKFSVYDELAEKDINIHIIKIPIIHHAFPDIDPKKNLQRNFTETEIRLIDELNDALQTMNSTSMKI